MLDGECVDRVLCVSGKDAVGKSSEPGKTMLDGGNSIAAVAMFVSPFSSLLFFLGVYERLRGRKVVGLAASQSFTGDRDLELLRYFNIVSLSEDHEKGTVC